MGNIAWSRLVESPWRLLGRGSEKQRRREGALCSPTGTAHGLLSSAGSQGRRKQDAGSRRKDPRQELEARNNPDLEGQVGPWWRPGVVARRYGQAPMMEAIYLGGKQPGSADPLPMPVGPLVKD